MVIRDERRTQTRKRHVVVCVMLATRDMVTVRCCVCLQEVFEKRYGDGDVLWVCLQDVGEE